MVESSRGCIRDTFDVSETVSIGAVQRGLREVVVRPFRLPALVADGVVVLEVSVVGICGTDLHQFRKSRSFHCVPNGHEYVATVVAVGTGVSSLRIGQRVAVEPFLSSACGTCDYCRAGLAFHCLSRTQPFGDGGFGQYVMARARGCFPLPDVIDDTLGALVEPLAVSTHAVRMLSGVRGKSGVVIGAGTVGLCALAAALDAGAAEVFVVAKYPAQQELALKLGAAGVIPVEATSSEAIRERFSKGLDFAIEAVGGTAQTLDVACDFLKPQGEIVVLGAFEPGFKGTETFKHLVKEITIRHSNCYGYKDGVHDFEVAIAHLARRGDVLRQLVSHEFPLERAPEAFQVANDKRQGVFKVQIRMPREKTLAACRAKVCFSKQGPCAGVRALSGFSHPESWGCWSDGKTVSITFDDPLPSRMMLMLQGHSFGPNAGEAFVAKIGEQSRSFVLPSDQDDVIWLEFEVDEGAREITIVVPEPVSPELLGLGPDPRLLGLGLVELAVFGPR